MLSIKFMTSSKMMFVICEKVLYICGEKIEKYD